MTSPVTSGNNTPKLPMTVSSSEKRAWWSSLTNVISVPLSYMSSLWQKKEEKVAQLDKKSISDEQGGEVEEVVTPGAEELRQKAVVLLTAPTSKSGERELFQMHHELFSLFLKTMLLAEHRLFQQMAKEYPHPSNSSSTALCLLPESCGKPTLIPVEELDTFLNETFDGLQFREDKELGCTIVDLEEETYAEDFVLIDKNEAQGSLPNTSGSKSAAGVIFTLGSWAGRAAYTACQPTAIQHYVGIWRLNQLLKAAGGVSQLSYYKMYQLALASKTYGAAFVNMSLVPGLTVGAAIQGGALVIVAGGSIYLLTACYNKIVDEQHQIRYQDLGHACINYFFPAAGTTLPTAANNSASTNLKQPAPSQSEKITVTPVQKE